jgi:predicted RNA methylase
MNVQIGEPHLFGSERDFFVAAVEKSRRYSEFGLGGSSLLAARIGVETIVAVDSDKAWVDGVRKNPEVAAKIADGSMAVLHGDIGPTRDWGNPVDNSEIRKWPNYIRAPWAEWGRRQSMPDLVFVDGRFRVACCLSVVVAFGAGAIPPPLTMMHDYNEERPHYQDVLEFFELEHLEGSLAFLRMREGASCAAALGKLLHRQFDYG